MRGSPGPAPARVGRATLGVRVADAIEAEIRDENLPVGHLLGSEAELAGRFEVGAAAVREAVRLLQARGLARSRRGPGGGIFVAAPDRGIVTEAARLYLEHTGVERDDLFEVWSVLESLAVDKLARSIDAEGATRLRALLRREEQATPQRWTEVPNVHLEIARLSGNHALGLFVQMLSELSMSQYGDAIDPRRAGRWLHDRHREIVEAIIAGDGAMAQLHLRRYMTAISRPDPSADVSDDITTTA